MSLIEGVPYIDRSVEHVGVSKLRTLNATNLSASNKTLVIQDNNTPLAVLLKYEQFLIMQDNLERALRTVELLSNRERVAELTQGLMDSKEERTFSVEEVIGSDGGETCG